MILEKRLPKAWAPRIQVVEYLRSFLLGRVGWSAFNGLMIISGRSACSAATWCSRSAA